MTPSNTSIRLTRAAHPSSTSDPPDLDDGRRLAALALAEQERHRQHHADDGHRAHDDLALGALDLVGDARLQRAQPALDVVARHLSAGAAALRGTVSGERGRARAHRRASLWSRAPAVSRRREMAATASAATMLMTARTIT